MFSTFSSTSVIAPKIYQSYHFFRVPHHPPPTPSSLPSLPGLIVWAIMSTTALPTAPYPSLALSDLPGKAPILIKFQAPSSPHLHTWSGWKTKHSATLTDITLNSCRSPQGGPDAAWQAYHTPFSLQSPRMMNLHLLFSP